MKQRLDLILVERELAESRHQALGLIMSHKVKVNGEIVVKAGSKFSEDASIELEKTPKYASRAGYKLAGALTEFPPLARWLNNKCVLDLGSSTGGFCDCLLQHGVSKIYAVDVGYGQMHPKLATDKRIVVLDRTNARYMSRELFDNQGEINFITADLSFISLKSVLPNIKNIFGNPMSLLLVKPQFELDQSKNDKGVVKIWEHRIEAIKSVAQMAIDLGWMIVDICSSNLLGPKGNQEFFLWLCHDDEDMKTFNHQPLITMIAVEKASQILPRLSC